LPGGATAIIICFALSSAMCRRRANCATVRAP
jgi:hypothetical protein